MNRALFSAACIVVLAAPALASVRGSSCTTTDPFIPGSTTTMCWTCTNGGPTAPDPECADEIALGYPDGWSVSCGTQEAIDSDGNPVDLSCSAGGQNVTFVDSDGGAGEVCPPQSWSFCVDVTAPATPVEPVCVFYTISGDGAGDEPHEIIDCATVEAARGSVTIIKETVPAGAGQAFEFTGDLGVFNLTGGESTTRTELEPGAFQVSESVPAGWQLTDLACVDPDGGTTVDLATGTASLDVDPGEEVTCTFRNTQLGTATIVKETDPAGATESFEFAGDLGSFTLVGGESTSVGSLEPGSYGVTESVPDGWQLSEIVCADPDGGTTIDVATGTASLDVDPGEEVTCTFRNTQLGTATIVKETDPAGSSQAFEFTGDLGAFTLAGGESTSAGSLEPGSYGVTERVPDGWQLSEIVCADPDGGTTIDLAAGTASLDVDPGEQVTCTFLNTARGGSVTIVKETAPAGSSREFEFVGDLGGFTLSGGGSSTMAPLDAGSYAVTEQVPAGWQLNGIVCDDPDGGTIVDLAAGTATIDVDIGEEIVCTFRNTALGAVTIAKETEPTDAGDQVFEFTGDLGAFTVRGGESSAFSELVPGTYAVSESLPGGWQLTGLTCSDPDGGTTVDLAAGTASLDVDAGETITCTYVNTATAASVTIVKSTLPHDSGGPFSFSGDLGAFALPGGGSRTFPLLSPGSYEVVEGDPGPGWELIGISCDDPDDGSTYSYATSSVVIDVDSGEEITCTFFNRSDDYQPGPPIPTLSPWMLVLLVAVLSVSGILLIRGRAEG